MDTLTHALSGALLARATAPARHGATDVSLRARVVAGALSAAFPDIDFVLGLASPAVYLETHRGVTHSVLLLPLWALLLAWVFARAAGNARAWRAWLSVAALGLAAHIVGDLVTSFGTMIAAPFSDARFAWGTTFIIDLWFTGIVVAGLAASLAWRPSRLPAVAASLVLAGYVGFQATLKSEAERFAVAHAAALGWTDARISVHPRPVSPLNWTVFVTRGDAIVYTHVNLRRTRVPPAPEPGAGLIRRLDAAYRPVTEAQWIHRTLLGETTEQRELVRSAWESPALAFFRWFADLPAFDGMASGSQCVAFRDLRFETPGRDAVPFRFTVCRDGPGAPWRLAEGGAVRR